MKGGYTDIFDIGAPIALIITIRTSGKDCCKLDALAFSFLHSGEEDYGHV